MRLRCLSSRMLSIYLFILTSSGLAFSQKKISCPDGEHLEIDFKQFSIQYDASSFAGTLSSLSALGARFDVAPKKLQEAAVATQQWDEFLKGLAAGYNACAVTRQQYAEGVNRIYPRLKEDAASLEEIRKIVSEGKKADEKRLQRLLDSYYDNLRSFAQISGKEVVLERIEALSEQVASGQAAILGQQRTDTETILAKLNELEQKNERAPLPTPAQVSDKISEIRKSLMAKAEEAEAAYSKGYALADQYSFTEAVPYLEQAVAAVPLPDFYLTLGRVYGELPDFDRAEKALREGLNRVAGKADDRLEARLALQLGAVLREEGKLDDALGYTQRALAIDEKVHGADGKDAAGDANNIGVILEQKGKLQEALGYERRALHIDEKVYGPDSDAVARDDNNIGTILKGEGNLDGSLSYARRALVIQLRLYGPGHPTVAIDASNIAVTLDAKRDFDGALRFASWALSIQEKVYGPDHPSVAIDDSNISKILQDKGDLKGSLAHARRSLDIDRKVYGPDHPKVAPRARRVSDILRALRDFRGALDYKREELRIDEKAYGANGAKAATDKNDAGTLLHAMGNLPEALEYEESALKDLEQAYGPDNRLVAITEANISAVLKDKGNLGEALFYAERSLKILEKIQGPDDPETKSVAAGVEFLRKATKQ